MHRASKASPERKAYKASPEREANKALQGYRVSPVQKVIKVIRSGKASGRTAIIT